jgi:hypothetical protein
MDDFYESPTYLDRKEFKAYVREITRIIRESETPLSVRDIHTKLGDSARRRWTADALEMAKGIKAVGILPTRYVDADYMAPERTADIPRSEQMKHFFPKRPKF